MSITIGPDGRPTGTVYLLALSADPWSDAQGQVFRFATSEAAALDAVEHDSGARVWLTHLGESTTLDVVPPVPARFVQAGTPLPTGEPARDTGAALDRLTAALDSVAAGGDAFLPDVEVARLGLLAEDGTERVVHAATRPTCTGGYGCPADVHIRGCYASVERPDDTGASRLVVVVPALAFAAALLALLALAGTAVLAPLSSWLSPRTGPSYSATTPPGGTR